jgi:hypothetical protein
MTKDTVRAYYASFGVLLGAGLRIEFLHEFPFAMRAKFAGMQRSDDGTWRFSKPPEFPLLFSLQARKPRGTHD